MPGCSLDHFLLDHICQIWHIEGVRKARRKDLLFVGDSHRVLSEFPDLVQRHVGYALYQTQMGNKHPYAKPLRSFKGGVLKVVSDHRRETFRTVYTVRLEHSVYVLHAFQTKSKHGIPTPQSEIELVKQRLQQAIEIDRERGGPQHDEEQS